MLVLMEVLIYFQTKAFSCYKNKLNAFRFALLSTLRSFTTA